MVEKHVAKLTSEINALQNISNIEEAKIDFNFNTITYQNFGGEKELTFEIRDLLTDDLYYIVNEVVRTTSIDHITLNFEHYIEYESKDNNFEEMILRVIQMEKLKHLAFDHMEYILNTLTIPSINISHLKALIIDQKNITILLEDTLKHNLEVVCLRVKDWSDLIKLSKSDNLNILDVICESKVDNEALYDKELEGVIIETKSHPYEVLSLIEYKNIGTIHINFNKGKQYE